MLRYLSLIHLTAASSFRAFDNTFGLGRRLFSVLSVFYFLPVQVFLIAVGDGSVLKETSGRWVGFYLGGQFSPLAFCVCPSHEHLRNHRQPSRLADPPSRLAVVPRNHGQPSRLADPPSRLAVVPLLPKVV